MINTSSFHAPFAEHASSVIPECNLLITAPSIIVVVQDKNAQFVAPQH